MEAQAVEYDSVADLRISVSDSEGEEYEVADEIGISLPTAVTSVVAILTFRPPERLWELRVTARVALR